MPPWTPVTTPEATWTSQDQGFLCTETLLRIKTESGLFIVINGEASDPWTPVT